MTLTRTCPARDALLVFLVLAWTAPAHAQHPFPYRLKSSRESVLLAVGAATLAGGVVVNAELDLLTAQDIAALDAADINGFDRPATTHWSPPASSASDVVLVAMLAAPLSMIAVAPAAPAPVTVGVMFGEVVLLTNGIGQLTKTIFRRVRPFAYNDDPDIPLDLKMSKTARQSFPSGHAANAFASAVFASTVFARLRPPSPLRYVIWGGSLATAGAVGYLRYNAGKHYPTDIIAGAVLGSAVGWLVPKMHETDRVTLALAAPGVEGTVLGLTVRF